MSDTTDGKSKAPRPFGHVVRRAPRKEANKSQGRKPRTINPGFKEHKSRVGEAADEAERKERARQIHDELGVTHRSREALEILGKAAPEIRIALREVSAMNADLEAFGDRVLTEHRVEEFVKRLNVLGQCGFELSLLRDRERVAFQMALERRLGIDGNSRAA